MICDKCDFEYDIGKHGEYTNVYGTRCPNCNHLIKPLTEAKFIRDNKEKMTALALEYLPKIREKLAEEIKEK